MNLEPLFGLRIRTPARTTAPDRVRAQRAVRARRGRNPPPGEMPFGVAWTDDLTRDSFLAYHHSTRETWTPEAEDRPRHLARRRPGRCPGDRSRRVRRAAHDRDRLLARRPLPGPGGGDRDGGRRGRARLPGARRGCRHLLGLRDEHGIATGLGEARLLGRGPRVHQPTRNAAAAPAAPARARAWQVRPSPSRSRASSPACRSSAPSSAATSSGAERLLRGQHALEEVAVLRDPLEHGVHRERGGIERLVHLVPAQRRRDGRARLRPHRVGRRDRLPLAVLVRVDQDAAPLRLRPLGRRQPGMGAGDARPR